MFATTSFVFKIVKMRNLPLESDLSISILGAVAFAKSKIPFLKIVPGEIWISLSHWFLISRYLFDCRCVSYNIAKSTFQLRQNCSAVSNLSEVLIPPELREIML